MKRINFLLIILIAVIFSNCGTKDQDIELFETRKNMRSYYSEFVNAGKGETYRWNVYNTLHGTPVDSVYRGVKRDPDHSYNTFLYCASILETQSLFPKQNGVIYRLQDYYDCAEETIANLRRLAQYTFDGKQKVAVRNLTRIINYCQEKKRSYLSRGFHHKKARDLYDAYDFLIRNAKSNLIFLVREERIDQSVKVIAENYLVSKKMWRKS